jgi:Fic family protein
MPPTSYNPPFELTAKCLAATSEIMRLVGRYEGMLGPKPEPKLRRQNHIRTVQGSLAIEGNTLGVDQVSAILDHKRVLGPKRDVVEVTNAIAAYARAANVNPYRAADLRNLHRLMMKDLIADAGRYRKGGVGIVRGSSIAHVAPPAKRVAALVDQLLSFLESDQTLHPLLQSAIAHYELEFIHPFSDGNGRMGRLWQHVVLVRYHPLFEYLPVESVVHCHQQEYYRVLGACDKTGSSTLFVEFSLATIRETLAGFLSEVRLEAPTAQTRLALARQDFGGKNFSRKDYLCHFPTLSTATASRDLRDGVEQGMLVRFGTKAQARYHFR